MRFVLTALAVGAIALIATAMVIVDVVVKLLPVLLIALVAVLAGKIWSSRRAAPTRPPAGGVPAPDFSAFAHPHRIPLAGSHRYVVGLPAAHPGSGPSGPRWPDSRPYPPQPGGMGGYVTGLGAISESDHRG